MTHAIGIDIGGTKMLGIVVDATGHIVSQTRASTGTAEETFWVGLTGLLGTLMERHSNVGAVGIGAPGLVGTDGTLVFMPHLQFLNGVALRSRLPPQFRAQLVVHNDANCTAWAELQHGAARGYREALVITLGTGIGGSIISGGELRLGGRGFSGEFGHMVVDPAGPRCSCGNNGCWESLASGNALGRLGREAARRNSGGRIIQLAAGNPEQVAGEHVMRAAADGDPAAHVVLQEFARWVALGLANLTNALDPEVIVMGGGVMEAGALVLECIRRAFEGTIEGAEFRTAPRIVQARFGERAGALGAALLAVAARERLAAEGATSALPCGTPPPARALGPHDGNSSTR